MTEATVGELRKDVQAVSRSPFVSQDVRKALGTLVDVIAEQASQIEALNAVTCGLLDEVQELREQHKGQGCEGCGGCGGKGGA